MLLRHSSASTEKLFRCCREIISRLENVYCQSIGAEYMHLFDPDSLQFIRERMEVPGCLEKTVEEKRLIMRRLTKAVLCVFLTLNQG